RPRRRSTANKGREERRGEDDAEPGKADSGPEDARDLNARPAALHNLFEPRIVRDIREAVGDLKPEVHRHKGGDLLAARAAKGRNSRKRCNDQEKSVHPVMVAVMHSRVTAYDLPGEEERTEQWNSVAEEPDVARETR